MNVMERLGPQTANFVPRLTIESERLAFGKIEYVGGTSALFVLSGVWEKRRKAMSAPKNLEECYTGELKDLISANDQMVKVVKDLHLEAKNADLKKHLKKSIDGIEKHTTTIEDLLKECGETGKEHCKGMEGLCKEARKHAIDEAPEDKSVQDVLILAQYQRLCHYGITGFGTASAFAEGLGKADHRSKLDQITSEIYTSDDDMTKVAETCVNEAAKVS